MHRGFNSEMYYNGLTKESNTWASTEIMQDFIYYDVSR
jgi:hypothetical protein